MPSSTSTARTLADLRRVATFARGSTNSDHLLAVRPFSVVSSVSCSDPTHSSSSYSNVHDYPDSVSSRILVNRGWVPRSWKEKFLEASHDEQFADPLPSPSQADGTRSWWRFWSKEPVSSEDQVPSITPNEVIGVIRGSEKPSIFVPANDPESSQWFYIDVPCIARHCGLPENTIYVEDVNENVNPSNPYPVPKDVNTLIRSSVMPQDHLNYILTWYSLSAAVTFMAFKRLRQKNTRR
ncbi:hypothetical protein TSUD_35030 [Trifolium subterraneum]|uniref:SURF1-like protein n=1 Tax=Trifolium subterraneum TaxID=3900 RepID=A0A2Z6MEF8_TRISU|nr:hypothetical protein TSUD_35030 [Trifolium subterraneum]